MDIEKVMKSLFQAEELTGENQYNHDQHGKQNAKKFMRIKKPPPVLQVNINRFGFSENGSMQKINSRCDFGETLDFDKILESSDSHQLSQNA